MGKRTREDMMTTWKEEKDRALIEKYKELQQHIYWDYTCKNSSSSSSFDLISMSPKKLMSCLQTENELSSLEVCSECSDCISNDESDHEEVRSVVASSAYVRGNTSCNDEMNGDPIDKCYDQEIYREIVEKTITCANVKNRETIRNVVSVGWVFSVFGLVLVSIGIAIAARDILSLVADDVDAFLPPT